MMDIYKELMQALSVRTDDRRRQAYDTLRDGKFSHLSIFMYPLYIVFGVIIGFLISRSTHALLFIGIIGAVGFFVSTALFKMHIRTRKKLDAITTLLLAAEDERKGGLIDVMPVVNKASKDK